MPSENAHLGQAEHNLALYDGLDRKKYSDWASTVLFYSALHYVDAYLARNLGVHPNGHADRDKYINTVVALKAARNDYRELKDYCHNARYAPPTRYDEAALQDMKDLNLNAVIKAVTPHLSPPPSP